MRRVPVEMAFRFVDSLFGDPRRLARRARGLVPFVQTAVAYKRQQAKAPASLRLTIGRLYPRLEDRFDSAGDARGHYFHQDLWAAALIHDDAPAVHVDLGSRIDGFVAHLLTFREVLVVDLRGLETEWPRLHFVRGNFRSLPFANSGLPSLSCLHALEHVGLGRYGDPVDPLGHVAASREMERVLGPGGRLYLSVPIGIERVEFNAHRVFAPDTIPQLFKSLHLDGFAAVDDDGRFHATANFADFRAARYSCGLYLFSKPQ